MGYVNDLADACRASGLPVWEDSRWRSRNHGAFATSSPTAIVCHHTGSSGSGAWTVVRDGRPGLAGPLAQLTLERDGSVRVLSNGVAWHAGTGSWPSIGRNNANSRAVGIEAVYNGSDITDAQRRAYPRLCAALCRHYRIPVGNVIGHREWAPSRKVDPGRIDMPAFRREVQRLVNGGTPTPAPSPVPRAPVVVPEEDDVQNFPVTGYGRLVLVCPTGAASANKRRAWLSCSLFDGAGSVRVFAQGDTAGVHDWWWTEQELTPGKDNLLARPWVELKSGVTKLVITYDFTKSPSGGVLCLETQPTT